MPIQENFVYTSTTDKPLPTIDEWISTLPGEQQLEYAMAAKRQQQLRQKVIEQNKLTVVKDQANADTYVWSDEYAKQKPTGTRKQWDRVWLEYWSRYLKETGAKFEIVERPVP